MDGEQFYELTLDDCATPSFISGAKPFYGRLSDIRSFVTVLEQDERCKENHEHLIGAFKAFESGDTETEHYAAYQKVRLLTPIKVLTSRTTTFPNHRWTHMNVWDCPYELRCEELIAEQMWIEREGSYLRCLRAKFKKLEYLSNFEKRWRDLIDGFWGYPHMLEYQEPYVVLRLWVAEEPFASKELALENAKMPEPGLCLNDVCDEMFGGG